LGFKIAVYLTRRRVGYKGIGKLVTSCEFVRGINSPPLFRFGSLCFTKSETKRWGLIEGGIKMNSCMRCGEKLSHNYLVAIFTIINEKRKRLIVCLKCKEILNKEKLEIRT